jgi:putative ABC transport system permease protein
MSLWSRVLNAFRPERVNREIDEELAAHLEDAQADGLDAGEARRALGSPLKHRDNTHDARVVMWLDSLRADAVYGWRRLAHNKVTTVAAILSLGLAIGACTAAFRLADALLWRPLPIASPYEIYEVNTVGVGFDGKPDIGNHWSYRAFALLRDAAKGDAELVTDSSADSQDIQYNGNAVTEKVYVQYVSGSMFPTFGSRPAAGRLLNPSDDDVPDAHALAVISDQYWKRRFARDPHAIGSTFQFGGRSFEIIGVVERPFTGTEPGKMVDVFLPVTMNPYVKAPSLSFLHIFSRVKLGTPMAPLRDKLQSAAHGFFVEQLGRMPGLQEQMKQAFMNRDVALAPAPAGSSYFQTANRRPLAALFVLSLLVLLIACANVANLVTAQTAARERELALRVSIGGGRRRLVQLVLAESAWIGAAAAMFGAAFAWWAAPRVVSMINPPNDPARLALPADWRVLGFLIAAAFLMTALFGLAPAMRASKVDPASALKGGEDPHARRRTMHVLIALQVGCCVFVVFTAGLFVMTFQRLAHKPTGFSSDRILTIAATASQPRPSQAWHNALEDLARQPGVASAALAGWPLLDGTNWVNSVALPGAPPSQMFAHALRVSPAWATTMRVPILEGRDLNWDDANPGAALVNESFAKTFFNGDDPVGRTFVHPSSDATPPSFTVVGLLKDTCYASLRECVAPTAYFPFADEKTLGDGPHGAPKGSKFATFIVKTESENPLAVAQALRLELARVAPEMHIMRIRTQREVNDAQTIHERLLSTLATFFAAVAILLAAVGLYGVLNYSVVRRRREIGIRITVGAQPASIARTVIARAFAMVLCGAVAGIGVGIVSARSFETLFYEVKATDVSAMATPAIAIFAAAVLAAIPTVIRAVRIDPVILLRAE